ncbi:MAG: gliding motility-associated C-terminal domain-containing protein, partial [Bacteroidetes bacterium]|nr:gliding motility-associated C-terminal domain-containing protein [Bacteroidota bacterium]
TSANISANTSGIYTVTVTDANGCTGSTTFNLTVNPNPSPAITGTTAFCQGANSTLSAGGGYASYLWSTGAVTPTLNVTTGGTYSVTVTNAAGCTGTTNTVVTVNPNPTPSITGTTAFCTGTSTTLNVGGTYQQYQWSTGSSANSITVTTANTFSVTVTDANGCTGTTSATTTINPLPTPSITGNNSICQGQSSTLSAGSYTSYQWSTGSTSANISANTSGIYTVTVTDANGCTGSTTFNLTVNPNPSPAITGTTAFCQGANSTLSAGGGYTSYLWSTGAVTPTLNVTTGGTYSVTVANAYGCSASASLPITVYSLPAPVINGPAGICPGASAALTTGSFAAYVWSTGSNTQTINTNVPGTYAVTVTDANGCIDSVSYTLAAYTNPTPVITGTAAICQNQSSLLDAGSFTSYNWSTGASTQTISVTQSGTYSVTVTNSNGCSAAASFAVLVNPLPTPAITGINAFCSGDSSQLTVTGNYPSYLWSTGASSSAVTVNAGGNYVVTVTDANGCTASASQSITVWSLPSPVISGDNNICIGETATLSTGNYASYQWSTGASTDSISTTTAGNYIVTVTDMNGCVNTSAPFNVAVHQLPSAIVSGTTAICVGQSTPVQIDITGTPPFRYGYTDGSTAFGPFTTSNSTVTIPVAPTSATTYTLNLITDLYCNGNFGGSAAITVNPLPQPVITGPSAICENETAMLNAGAFAAYQWSTGENTAFINANTNGNYTCTVTSAVGCVNSANFYLTVNPLPVVTFTNDSSLTCEVPRIHFTNTSVYPAGSVFSWNFGDAVSSEMNPVHQYDSSGTYPVTLIITTPAGCVDSSTQNVDITIFPLPLAQFDVSPDFAPLYNSTIELKDNSENAVTWHWDFGDGQKSDIPVSQYQYQSPGKYTITLQITNIAGCESVTSREVFITPFFIPNAFTPNGDGKNETFYDPGYAFDVSSVTMRIWNRWGQMVFSSDNMSHVWDGKDASGNDAPQGVYYYTLKVVQNSGHENDYAGSVTLVR